MTIKAKKPAIPKRARTAKGAKMGFVPLQPLAQFTPHTLILWLECPKGHKWESEVTTVDWRGPLFHDAFCLTCYRPGKRQHITSEGIGGILTAEEITEVGQGAIHTLLFVLHEVTKYQGIPQHAPIFTCLRIGQLTAERAMAVAEHIDSLTKQGWITATPTEDDRNKYLFGYGPRLQAAMDRSLAAHMEAPK